MRTDTLTRQSHIGHGDRADIRARGGVLVQIHRDLAAAVGLRQAVGIGTVAATENDKIARGEVGNGRSARAAWLPQAKNAHTSTGEENVFIFINLLFSLLIFFRRICI